ncbi:MAG: hypothetical protein JWN13_3495 [Betaproteobacteria bacterium]|nr:hypothetical protein [Betaproteobacteria bacterium]
MTLTEAAILSFSPAGFILCRCIAEWRGINGIVAMLSEMPDERYVEFVQGFPRKERSSRSLAWCSYFGRTARP